MRDIDPDDPVTPCPVDTATGPVTDAVFVVDPAITYTPDPVAELVAPPSTEMSPARPPVDAPVPRTRVPVDPDDAVPELITITPELPAVAAPDSTDTLPDEPVDAVPVPMSVFPELPRVVAPLMRDVDPELPDDAAPDPMYTTPVLPTELVPV